VLRAMNPSSDSARRSLRFSLGRFNSESQIDRAIEIVPKVVEKLRDLSAPARETAVSTVATAL
jgi:cysteine desulfurase